LAEAIVGDIAPGDGVSKEEKRSREKEALEKMCFQTLSGPVGKHIKLNSQSCFYSRTNPIIRE
jgi:5'-deoxynucleotidase YfbR-like HD superfamily hydrolase